MLESLLFIGFLILLLSTVYFYFELKNTKEKYALEQKENNKKLFELAILNEVSDKIGYSLSSKDIASVIAATAEKVFEVSAVSYGVVEGESVEVTTITHENVGPQYINGVKDIILQSMYGIDPNFARLPVAHYAKGVHIDPQAELLVDTAIQYDARPLSYFNIPLVLNNKFTGIINITSSKAHAYQEEDMSMLYKIVNKAQLAIGRLESVIENEKGKVDSLVKSLSSGEMFFTLENDSLHLFTINAAAKRFLHIGKDNLDLVHVLGSFNLQPNIIREMKDVIVHRKCTLYRDIAIGELRFNIYLAPVFDIENERVIGVSLTMQDITREHETQKIREAFTNMMIHELRAPLTAIKGAAELLLRPETQEEDRVKMRLIIKSASERLLDDIDDMLDSAKIDAGKLKVEITEADLQEVVEKTVQELSYAAQDKSILIENHITDHIPPFAFDPVRIGQVIVNLLSNAIKHSEPHTIIEVFTRLKEDTVEVEVRDHGSGIESDKLSTLFQPFSQAHFYKKEKGTGLGLYISKAIIAQHDGKIWLESEVGKGTRAIFTLPLNRKETTSYESIKSYVN